MRLVAALQDRALGDYAKRLERMGAEGAVVLSKAFNTAAAELRSVTVDAESRQTGLDRKTIDRAQKGSPSTPSSLSYRIRSQGGDVRLKYFGPQETTGGVVAHPLGEAKVFAHAFTMGGRFPNRVAIGKLNGQVIERIGVRGKDKPWSRTVRSGVVIPKEMVTGNTAAAFEKGVATIVVTQVVSRLGAMLP